MCLCGSSASHLGFLASLDFFSGDLSLLSGSHLRWRVFSDFQVSLPLDGFRLDLFRVLLNIGFIDVFGEDLLLSSFDLYQPNHIGHRVHLMSSLSLYLSRHVVNSWSL